MMAENVVEFPGASQAQSVITEDAVAELVAREHGEDIRFCPEMGKWLRWSGLRWEVDETGQVFELAKDVCRVITVQTGKDKWGNHRTVKSVENFLKTRQELVLRAAELDADTMIMGTPKGYVDLKTGQACKPDKRVYTTKIAAVDPAPAGAKPKRWLEFLQQVTNGDDELIRFLKVMCGYTLTGETGEQCLFFLFGPGGNGKSVFLNVLAGIMGDYARTAAMDVLQKPKGDRHSHVYAELAGARLVTSNENQEGVPWAEERVKQMTGQDKITANFMRENSFTYMPEYKLLVVGNHKPTLNTVDDAIKRRFNLIPFTYKPPERSPNLEKELRREWPAILRWMIEGCTDWQAEGMQRPQIVQDETKEFFHDQDIVAQWIEDNCITDQYKWEPTANLHKNYIEYMKDARAGILSRTAFTQMMSNRNYKPAGTKWYQGSAMRSTAGITLKTDANGDRRVKDD